MAFGHRHFVEIHKFLCSVCVCVCVFVGARGSTMKLKSGNIGVGMPRARGRKPPEEKEEMSQGTSER